MDMKTSLERVLQSQDTIGESFYDRLFRRHPEAREHFRNVDLKRQAVLLTMQLSVIEVFHSTRSPASEKYLQVLGTKHCEWGVPQDVYPQFNAVLVETLRCFHGEDWSEDLAAQWQAAIDAATAKMLEGYQQPLSE
jgi:hemoglobin-like flavoprotein